MSDSRSSLRQRHAQITRRLIVDAARKLFLEGGYANTTIESIADQAGVAVSTIYAVFRSKRGILRAIRKAWHHQSHIQEFLYSHPADADPAQSIERLAAATRLQWDTGLDVIKIYRGAAAADSEAAAELQEAMQGRQKGLDTFTALLKDHLRHGLDLPHASAIVRALCQPEVYEELVVRSGWTAEAYQGWLASAIQREILETA